MSLKKNIGLRESILRGCLHRFLGQRRLDYLVFLFPHNGEPAKTPRSSNCGIILENCFHNDFVPLIFPVRVLHGR